MTQLMTAYPQTQETYLKYSQCANNSSQVHLYLKAFWGDHFHPPLYIATYVHLWIGSKHSQRGGINTWGIWIIWSILALYFRRWITSSLLLSGYTGSPIARSDAGDYLVDVSVGKDVHYLSEVFDVLNDCIQKNWTYV